MKVTRSQVIRSMVISAGLLAIFAVVGGGLVALTEQLTRDRIAENERRARLASLQEILPADAYDNDLVEDTIELQDVTGLNLEPSVVIHRAFKEGEPVAAIFPLVAPDGYGGPIHLLMGVHMDGRIAGVRVTRHSETPGLGDPIEARRSDWIHDFQGRQLGDAADEKWQVQADGGEFDQFTGATITPRAVVRAVRRGLVYFETNKPLIFPEETFPQDPEQ
ncbi:electron transport complex protein RnfG [Natronospira proteinivora]|uniref:Ion-translocating oxidoreductase complex subunit G n=1 Tax=Natronospira proteinivora TaxID=1807133 RepID=A0ABT1G4D3_9GAMM|nr:electron transport complex subunit RsxG [Natronospira proteinivora]MCP1726152.1 electron transport complex protein RnfG [Natronospira proteinivora]